MRLTPTQIAQLMPGYVQAPSKDGKSAFCAWMLFITNAPCKLDLRCATALNLARLLKRLPRRFLEGSHTHKLAIAIQ